MWVPPNRVGEEANSHILVKTVKDASGQACCFSAPSGHLNLASPQPRFSLVYFVMQMSHSFNQAPPPPSSTLLQGGCWKRVKPHWQALVLASSASTLLKQNPILLQAAVCASAKRWSEMERAGSRPGVTMRPPASQPPTAFTGRGM